MKLKIRNKNVLNGHVKEKKHENCGSLPLPKHAKCSYFTFLFCRGLLRNAGACVEPLNCLFSHLVGDVLITVVQSILVVFSRKLVLGAIPFTVGSHWGRVAATWPWCVPTLLCFVCSNCDIVTLQLRSCRKSELYLSSRNQHMTLFLLNLAATCPPRVREP